MNYMNTRTNRMHHILRPRKEEGKAQQPLIYHQNQQQLSLLARRSPTHKARSSRPSRQEWLQDIQSAEKRRQATLRITSGLDPTTLRRHGQIKRELLLANDDATALAQMWYERLKPSTAVTYIRTLKAIRPDLVSPVINDVLVRARKEAPVIVANRAKAATPQETASLCRRGHLEAVTVRAMWVTASRHADLGRIVQATLYPENTVMLQWGTMKSDRFGQRGVTKCVYWKGQWPRKWASYTAVMKYCRSLNPELSAHSFRRGAVCFLAARGYSFHEIAALTAHTPTEDPCLAVRRYADPHPAQQESRAQRAMSQALQEALEN
eukprot:PhM_4_TR15898/c2_g1_i1/m.71902